MPDSTISQLPAGTVTVSWVLPADDSAGSATYKVTVSSILALLTDATQFTTGTLPDARLSANIVRTSDARLSDSRTPSAHKASHYTGGSDELTPANIGAAAASHTHGNITAAGAIGAASGLPVITSAGGVLIAGAFGSSAGTFCSGNDSRLSDARTPSTHAASHQTGQSDALSPAVVTLALTGTNNAVAIGSADVVRVTCTGNVTINGFASSGIPDAAPKLIVNETASGGGTLTLAHESSSATAADRIYSQSGAAVVLQPDGGQVFLHRSSTKNRWRV